MQDIFWEGIAELNDLFKEENKVQVMQTHRLDEPNLKLVKLHGSHEWYKLGDATIVKSESNRIRIGGKTVTGEMVLYPLNQKDLYLDPWIDFFKRFKIDLIKTQNWVVIGYSFNDLFIREIFLEYINRPNHKLIIVDPNASGIIRDHFGTNRTNVEAIDNRVEDNEAVLKVKNAILSERG